MSEKCDCKYYESLINKRLDGDISPEENSDLNNHLAVCDPCRDELVSFEIVRSLLDQTSTEQVDVPEGFFEAMAEDLVDVEPAKGLSGILNHPFFQVHRNMALAGASVLAVMILVIGVGVGIADQLNYDRPGDLVTTEGLAYIQTNNGNTIVVSDDQAEYEEYATALDDLENAYREAQGLEDTDDASGYIHTSWRGGDSDNPIR